MKKPQAGSHTQGDWEVKDLTVKCDGLTICDMRYKIPGTKEAQSNATLIAAAPDMLNALREVLAFEKRGADKGEPRIGTGILDIIHKAVKKATKE